MFEISSQLINGLSKEIQTHLELYLNVSLMLNNWLNQLT